MDRNLLKIIEKMEKRFTWWIAHYSAVDLVQYYCANRDVVIMGICNIVISLQKSQGSSRSRSAKSGFAGTYEMCHFQNL